LKIEINSERKTRFFSTNEFLARGDKGKIGIKIIGVITMNLEIFKENFRIFGYEIAKNNNRIVIPTS
jgi:hypothetical protein